MSQVLFRPVQLFDLAPVSLWLEDFSALKQLFDNWRSQGVTDLQAHVQAHPSSLAECAACLLVLQVNQRSLEIFSTCSQDELLANLDKVFRGDMLSKPMEQLLPMWEGSLGFSANGELQPGWAAAGCEGPRSRAPGP